MKNVNASKLAKIAIVAALYAVLTIAIAPISYGGVQFRLSEVMVLLAFIDPLYIPGLVLGCAISNLFSPLGIIDVFVGSFATFLSVYMISRSKKLFVATLWPVLFNGLIVGAELYYAAQLPFLLTSFQVAFGEFVVVSIVGYIAFRIIVQDKNIINALRIGNIRV